MRYIQGFLIPVPKENKDAYRELAAKAAAIFQDYGALRVVESWADDIPDGKVTDFKKAVLAKEGEAVVFAWTEWPDKQTCDAAASKMDSDPRWKEMPEMPFDSSRMIWAGFSPLFEAGS